MAPQIRHSLLEVLVVSSDSPAQPVWSGRPVQGPLSSKAVIAEDACEISLFFRMFTKFQNDLSSQRSSPLKIKLPVK